MATVNSLKSSISELDRNDAIRLLIDIRQQRREAKSAPARKKRKTSKTKKKKTKKSKKDMLSILKNLSPEEARKLLNTLS